ncbi:hypothetical protein BO83DRAFT_409477 [Aspergillus eucalypticola CBS 122712]|uniref:Uncharacterized protein n=1 Tax=Aspergillus eucalypticola (strain CBS 122712 / IBT 29274) TaxID=1448314 RepID=A0A317V944_ASPEC|nr:uncharacterized protein BO83DRAFT_409477 [Aspergillus eucalypticola CBS 122712]PWY69372.1 hypothetical protein BO83DRAFT_409477 [Aspergillus eucalypticola CBS 122712]
MLLRIQAVVLNNRQRILEAYIDAGVNPDIVSAGHGMGSLLFIAAISNYSDMVEFLFQKGAEPRRRPELPSEWSMLDEVGLYIHAEKPVDNWGKTMLSFLQLGVIFSELIVARQLCGIPNAPHFLEVALRNGLDIHRTWRGISLLHIAAGSDNRQLLKTILSHAPEQLHAQAILDSTRYPIRHQPALDVAISSGITMNVGYLLDVGSKPTFYSLEDAIQICKTGRGGDRVEFPYESPGWRAWKLLWVGYVQRMASKLDLDSVEAASTLEKILRDEAWSDGSLYLPALFRKMSRRSRLLYARRLDFRRYEVRLTVARIKLQELEDNLDRLKPSWWQALDRRVSRDRSINLKIIQELEKAKERDYVEQKVKGLEKILEPRHEAAVDLP